MNYKVFKMPYYALHNQLHTHNDHSYYTYYNTYIILITIIKHDNTKLSIDHALYLVIFKRCNHKQV